jgi:hypothetical protein
MENGGSEEKALFFGIGKWMRCERIWKRLV